MQNWLSRTIFWIAYFACHLLFRIAIFTCHLLFQIAIFTCHLLFRIAIFTCHLLFRIAIFTCHLLFRIATFACLTSGRNFSFCLIVWLSKIQLGQQICLWTQQNEYFTKFCSYHTNTLVIFGLKYIVHPTLSCIRQHISFITENILFYPTAQSFHGFCSILPTLYYRDKALVLPIWTICTKYLLNTY